MTVAELLTRIGNEKRSQFTDAQLILWLNEVESQICDYLGMPREDWVVYTNDAESKAKTLLALPPHDDLYLDWIKAKIDFTNEDFDSYSNQQMQFFANFHEYKSYALRKGLRIEELPAQYSNVW